MYRFIKIVAAILLMLMISTGCWSRIEVEDLAIASAIGIDKIKHQGQNKIQISMLVIKPARPVGGMGGISSGPSGGGGSEWINFGEGNSVDDAKRDLSTTTPKKLFLGHCRFVVFGEKTAREGVGDIIDYLERDKNFGLKNWVIVSKDSAFETLQIKTEMENLVANEVSDLLALSEPLNSKTYAVNFKEFLADLSAPGKEAVVPLLEIRSIPPSVSANEQQGEISQPHKNARVKGLAVFKGDKMIGELADTETKGFLWVIGKAKEGTLSFKVKNIGTKKPTQVTIEMIRAGSQIQTQLVNGKPAVTVKIAAEGNLGEFSDPDATIKMGDIELLNKGYAAEIKKQAELALRKCQQEFKSDVFGFGTIFHRQHARYWKEKKLEQTWGDIFPELPVKVEVKAYVRRSGVLSSSIPIK